MTERKAGSIASDATEEIRRGVVLWAVKQAVAITLFGVAAFLSAGRTDWPGGWSLTGVLTAYFLFTLAFLVPRNPALYAERSGMKRGTKKWDLVLSMLVAYTPLYICIVAGLDMRHGWARPLSTGLWLGSFLVTALGLAVLSWAMMANTFFAATVRIQEERGHSVVSAGPYRVIRHPGYAGSIIYCAGLAGVTGSPWAFVVVAAFLVPLVVRTALEDATLRRELPGYRDYCARTRFRLVPGVW
jgi:protein-S-isoprenylcysteine O-methyltransferase Ste14